MALRFISVIDVLVAIQECVAVSEPPQTLDWSPKDDQEHAAHGAAAEFWGRCEPQLREARCYAEAARSLNEALYNGNEKTKPQWVQYATDLRFATGEGAHGEIAQRDGVAILTHASRAYYHQMQRIREHTGQYPDPCAVELTWNVRFVIAPPGLFTRLNYVGFDRERLVPFLRECGIRHALSEVPASRTAGQAWSDERKLALLDEYGEGGRVTHAKLGERNNVSRQFIARILKEARSIKKRGCFPGPQRRRRR